MKKIEFENYKKHLLGYMTEQEIVDQAKEYLKIKSNLTYYHAGKNMVQDGFFEIYYSGVMEALEEIYGDDFNRSVYEDKDGYLKWKNDECYCWTVYKHKVGLTIEKMAKELSKGE